MKLFDFDDPEFDEQIRLLTDVLYNHRFIYSNQLTVQVVGSRNTPDIKYGSGEVTHFEYSGCIDHQLTHINRREIESSGFSPVPTSLNYYDHEAFYLFYETPIESTQFRFVQTRFPWIGRIMNYNPYYQVWLKMPPTSGEISNLILTGVLGDPYSESYFRYDPAWFGNNRFNLVYKDGSGTPQYINLTNEPDVEPNRQYFLSFQWIYKTGTGLFDVKIICKTELRDSNGAITSQTDNTYQVLDLDIQHATGTGTIGTAYPSFMMKNILIGMNSDPSVRKRIKFHHCMYAHTQGVYDGL